jgi:hypothetical protein
MSLQTPISTVQTAVLLGAGLCNPTTTRVSLYYRKAWRIELCWKSTSLQSVVCCYIHVTHTDPVYNPTRYRSRRTAEFAYSNPGCRLSSLSEHPYSKNFARVLEVCCEQSRYAFSVTWQKLWYVDLYHQHCCLITCQLFRKCWKSRDLNTAVWMRPVLVIAQLKACLRPLAYWDHGFESLQGHKSLCDKWPLVLYRVWHKPSPPKSTI